MLDEEGSDQMRQAWRSARLMASVAIARVELAAALHAAVRLGRIPTTRLPATRQRVREVWADTAALAVEDQLISDAVDLAEAYGLRGYDAVHLAGLNRLGVPSPELAFACWDGELRAAAQALGYQLFPL